MNDPLQLNVEYFFRKLYELRVIGEVDISTLAAKAGVLWLWIVAIGYAVALIALVVLVYTTMRLFDLRKKEREELTTLIQGAEKTQVNDRWVHVEALAASTSPSDWRQAIIEADIMLDDALAKAGHGGRDLGERLKSIDRSVLASVDDAWEAHKVRNQIAHQGSAFDLSETVARRTIARYQTVFRELRVI